VDARAIDWTKAFCSAEVFGGLIETEVLDLNQALERYAECDPVFLVTDGIWRHDGRDFSLERLLEGWDAAVGRDAGRPLALVWRELCERRTVLAGHIRELLVHPREFLDTHRSVRETCADYLVLASELYGGVQSRFQVVSDESPEWAQATLDALLSLDLLQVRIRQEADRVAAKAVMLPLHPLHLWRYYRMGEMLRSFAGDSALQPEDRRALLEELQRPEQFLSVVRAGRAPAQRGLDQVLPVAKHIHGLATFENLKNAISSADGVDTLVRAIDNYVLLYPNHARPLRLALVNPPEPTRIIDRVVKLLEDRRGVTGGIGRIEVDIFSTDLHGDRLAAAAVLEGGAQDLIYEKVAAERLEIRVASAPDGPLAQLIDGAFGHRRYHVLGLFDESSIAIRKQRIEGFLRMSPFCIRNEIKVDSILGEIKLRPHPGEPPFSDFVLMIQARQGERLDTAMYAAADADELRALKRCYLNVTKMPATAAGHLKPVRRVEIADLEIVGPAHTKSSADGIRVKLILPPTLPPSGGFHGPTLTRVRPNFVFAPSIARPNRCRQIRAAGAHCAAVPPLPRRSDLPVRQGTVRPRRRAGDGRQAPSAGGRGARIPAAPPYRSA
jgi:hypothetical protein